jgi:hypothetical protein
VHCIHFPYYIYPLRSIDVEIAEIGKVVVATKIFQKMDLLLNNEEIMCEAL